MAFNLDNWDRLSMDGDINVPRIWTYYSPDDDLATIEVDGYFNLVELEVTDIDYIFVRGSDGSQIYQVDGIDPNVTIVAIPDTIFPGSLVNGQFAANAAIAFSKLANLDSGKWLIGDANNVATPRTIAGDLGSAASGALTIGNNKVTSTKIADNIMKLRVVTITPDQVRGMYANPVELIPAPGPGKLILMDAAATEIVFNTVAYTAGGAPRWTYGSVPFGLGPQATASAAVSLITTTGSMIYKANENFGDPKNLAQTVNTGIYLSNLDAPFTSGNSNILYYGWYKIVSV